MGRSYDIVIAGLGIAGCAVARELTRRGARVLGLDLHKPPHEWGSSHGRTRIIREAYFEDPLYVPLVRSAFDLWAEVEAESGRQLLVRTGALTLGETAGDLLRGTLASALTHDIAHESLATADIRTRFPALAVAAGTAGLLEERAGVLHAEPCSEALLDLARRGGAEFRFNEPLLSWRTEGHSLVVRTPGGEVPCGRLVLTAGPWTPSLLAAAGLSSGPGLEVERQAIAFFALRADPVVEGRLPVVLWEYRPGGLFYLLPDTGHGVKAGVHHEGVPFDPASDDRAFHNDDLTKITTLFDRLLPGARGELLDGSVCLYTNTPDSRFLMDAHPQNPNVIVVSACSGHGFKFAPAVARIAADLTLGHPPGAEATPFRWRSRRPGTAQSAPGPSPANAD